jgi:hypothetical protein
VDLSAIPASAVPVPNVSTALFFVRQNAAGDGYEVIAPAAVRTALSLGALATLSSVGAAQIDDGSVGAAELGADAVTTVKIADANVTTAKLANNAADHTKVAVGAVVQVAYAEYTTNADVTGTIPADDTIPQNTEGVEILNVSITPKSTTNKLRVIFSTAFVTNTAGGVSQIHALFRDSSANAIAVCTCHTAGSGFVTPQVIIHEFVPGTTSPVTLSVRGGNNGGVTFRYNGSVAARQFGGVFRTILAVEEIKA